jgi:hypothetical protein
MGNVRHTLFNNFIKFQIILFTMFVSDKHAEVKILCQIVILELISDKC